MSNKPLSGWEEIKLAVGVAVVSAVLTALSTGYATESGNWTWDWGRFIFLFVVILVSYGIGSIYGQKK